MINRRLRKLIADGADSDTLLAAARENGFVTMQESCRQLVLSGVTSAEEAARTINTTVDG